MLNCHIYSEIKKNIQRETAKLLKAGLRKSGGTGIEWKGKERLIFNLWLGCTCDNF